MTFCPDNSVLKEFASVCIDWRYWLGIILCFHFWAYLCRLHNAFKRNSNLSGKVLSFLLSIKKCEHTVETKLHIKLCCVRVLLFATLKHALAWRDAASVFRENGKYPSRGLKGFFMPRTAPLVIKGQNKRYLAPTEQNQSNKNTRPFCNIHGHLQISIQGHIARLSKAASK